MACNVSNTIFHMSGDFYHTLKEFGSTLLANEYKIILLHLQSPEKDKFYNIPIYVYAITNDHYVEVSLEYTPKSNNQTSNKCSTVSKLSTKVILSDKDEYHNILTLVKFMDSIFAHVLMTGDNYDATAFKNYSTRTLVRMCVCDTNFCIAYKPHVDENTTRISTWSYDKTLVRSHCFACNEIYAFTEGR